MFVNNQIFIYLTNSFLLRFDINGRLSDIQKLPNKIKSYQLSFRIIYYIYPLKINFQCLTNCSDFPLSKDNCLI